jgi:hypothetical protein
LKRGSIPRTGIEVSSVGRINEIKKIQESFEGEFKYWFVQANYGYGKSHLLKIIESVSLRANYACSYIVFDGFNHAFNHPMRYLHSIMENLKVPGFQHELGLFNALKFWLCNGMRDDLLGSVSFLGESEFTRDLTLLARGVENEDLRNRIEMRHLRFKAGRNQNDIYYQKIKLLSKICKTAGLNGLVVLMDEVESIVTLLPGIRSRLISYEILNTLVDQRCFTDCIFLFAITPDFDFKMAKEYSQFMNYEMLYPKGVSFAKKWKQRACNIVELNEIAAKDNFKLCCILRTIHGFAYSWDAKGYVDDQFIDKFVKEAHRVLVSQRDISKAFINILEIIEQHKGYCDINELQCFSFLKN